MLSYITGLSLGKLVVLYLLVNFVIGPIVIGLVYNTFYKIAINIEGVFGVILRIAVCLLLLAMLVIVLGLFGYTVFRVFTWIF